MFISFRSSYRSKFSMKFIIRSGSSRSKSILLCLQTANHDFQRLFSGVQSCKVHSQCQSFQGNESRRLATLTNINPDFNKSFSYCSRVRSLPTSVCEKHALSTFSKSSCRPARQNSSRLTCRTLWAHRSNSVCPEPDPVIRFLKPVPQRYYSTFLVGLIKSGQLNHVCHPHYDKSLKNQVIAFRFYPRTYTILDSLIFRLYSKDSTGSEEENNNINYSNDNNSDQDIVKKFPDLKNILDEMKKDFNESSLAITSDSSSDSDSSSSSDDELPDTNRNLHSPNASKSAQEEEFIYDYRYADDIEDFGFAEDREGVEEETVEKIVPIPLSRGKDGVFDLDELLTFLDHLGAENVVTIEVPPEANYCDNMVVCSAKSQRHLQFINDEFLWIHKRKKGAKDQHLHIEGLNRSEWCAMDMGNIVLHVFYGDARDYYDIESLWTLGPENDPKCQEQTHDPLALSEEDLFWLEASKDKEESTDSGTKTTDDSHTPPRLADGESSGNLVTPSLDQEAGWGESTPKPPSKSK